MFLQDHRQLLGLLLLVQGQAEHRLGVDRQLACGRGRGSRASRRCRRRRRPAPCRPRRRGCRRAPCTGCVLVGGVLEQLDLLGLVVLEPVDAASRACRATGRRRSAWRSAGRGRRRPWCAARSARRSRRTSPSRRRRAASRSSALTPACAMRSTSLVVEDRVAVEPLPAFGASVPRRASWSR